MTKYLAQLAIGVAGLVVLVGALDYQHLMARHQWDREVRRQLAVQLVEQACEDLALLNSSRGFQVGTIAFDADGVVRQALIARGESVESPSVMVAGQIDEWVTDPLPMARLRVTLRITTDDGRVRTRELNASVRDGAQLHLTPALSTRLERFVSDLTKGGPRWASLLLLVLPWLAVEFLKTLLRRSPNWLTALLAFGYLIAVGWIAQQLWANFEEQRLTWLGLLIASSLVLMHLRDDQDSPRTAGEKPAL
ncbi:MAG: hypothetical protein ACKV2Q_03620 [Planctomycetaceae bacterium]